MVPVSVSVPKTSELVKLLRSSVPPSDSVCPAAAEMLELAKFPMVRPVIEAETPAEVVRLDVPAIVSPPLPSAPALPIAMPPLEISVPPA